MIRRLLLPVAAWFAVFGLSTAATGPAAEPVGRAADEDRLPPGAIGRFGSTAFRAQGWSTAAALSRDGKTLAIGGEAVTLTDLATGKTLARFEETEPVHLAFLENDQMLASVSPKGVVRYWSLEKKGEARPAWQAFAPEEGDDPIAAASPNGELLLTKSEGNFQVWDLGRQTRLHRFPIPDPTHSLSCGLAPDGRTVAIVPTYQGRLVSWDARTGKPLARSDFELTDYGFYIGFSPDGKRIAVAGPYGSYRVCDAATLRQTHYLRQYDKGRRLIAFSPDGRLLATTLGDLFIALWDMQTGQVAAKVDLTLDGRISYFKSLFFSPDGRRMIAAEEEGPLTRIWDAATGRELTDASRPQRSARTIRASADGKTLATTTECTTYVWDTATYRLRFQVPVQFGSRPGFSQSSEKIVYANRDRSLRVVDAVTGKELLELAGHVREIRAVAFAANDAKIVAMETDHTVRAWDAVTGTEVRSDLPGIAELFGIARGTAGVAYSPDGKRTAVRREKPDGVELRNVATGTIVHTIALDDYPHGIGFVGNRRLAIGRSDTTVLLWDVSRARDENAGREAFDEGKRQVQRGTTPFFVAACAAGVAVDWFVRERRWVAEQGRIIRPHASNIPSMEATWRDRLWGYGAAHHVRRIETRTITDPEMAYLPGLPILESLSIYENPRVTDAGIAHLAELTNLRFLLLTKTKITDAGLAQLGGLGRVSWCMLAGDGITGSGFKHLSGMKALKTLDVDGPITDEGLEHLGKLTQLTELGLYSRRCTDAGLHHLGKLTQLKTLHLDVDQVTDRGLEEVGRLKQLWCLQFRSDQCTDAGLRHLHGLKHLELLFVGGNKITDAGIAELQKALPMCKVSR